MTHTFIVELSFNVSNPTLPFLKNKDKLSLIQTKFYVPLVPTNNGPYDNFEDKS